MANRPDAHRATVDWVIVPRGEATLRTPKGERALRHGDVICFHAAPNARTKGEGRRGLTRAGGLYRGFPAGMTLPAVGRLALALAGHCSELLRKGRVGMASSGKTKTTLAKPAREQKVREPTWREAGEEGDARGGGRGGSGAAG